MGSASVDSTNHTYKIFRKEIIALVLNIVYSLALNVPQTRQYYNYLQSIDSVWDIKAI